MTSSTTPATPTPTPITATPTPTPQITARSAAARTEA